MGDDRRFVGAFRASNDGHAFFSVTGYANFQQAVEANNALGLRLVDVYVEP